MKEKLLLTLTLFLSLISSAQIPVGYYSTAENNSDADLKYALNQIIDNHTEFPYTDSGTDTWDILKETDRDPNNSSNVILIYSGISVNGAQEYNNANGWTREHVWAKSRGDFGTALGPGTDVHALRPLDNSTNSTRSNRGFDDCTDCVDVYDKWSNNTGSKRDNTDWSFEPRVEVEKKRQQSFFIPFDKSPKVLITSNYPVKGPGGSSDERRRHEFEILNHYDLNFTPEMEFGNRFFEKHWSDEERTLLYYTNVY